MKAGLLRALLCRALKMPWRPSDAATVEHGPPGGAGFSGLGFKFIGRCVRVCVYIYIYIYIYMYIYV